MHNRPAQSHSWPVKKLHSDFKLTEERALIGLVESDMGQYLIAIHYSFIGLLFTIFKFIVETCALITTFYWRKRMITVRLERKKEKYYRIIQSWLLLSTNAISRIIASIVDIQIIWFIKYTLCIFIFNYSGFPFEMNQLSWCRVTKRSRS